MNRIRSALAWGYPKSLRLVFDHGFASAHLELGGLAKLVKRVRIDLWDQGDSHSAETAGWLALASLYREGWARRTENSHS